MKLSLHLVQRSIGVVRKTFKHLWFNWHKHLYGKKLSVLAIFKKDLPKLNPRHAIDAIALVLSIAALVISWQANQFAKNANKLSQDENRLIQEANDFSRQMEQSALEREAANERDLWYRQALEFSAKGRENSLRGADLQGRDLSEVDLNGADLRGANLSGANLDHANLSEASLVETNFFGASLTEANLRLADLRDTNFSNANLTGAVVEGSLIDGTDFRGATLIGTNLSEALYPFVQAPKVLVEPIEGWRTCSCTDNESICITDGVSCGFAGAFSCYCEGFTADGKSLLFDESTLWPDDQTADAYLSSHFTSVDFPLFFGRYYAFHLRQSEKLGKVDSVRLYLYKLGNLALYTGFYQDAIIRYTQALDIDSLPTDSGARAKILENLGQAYQQSGDLDSASRVWNEAILHLRLTNNFDSIQRIEEHLKSLGN